MKKQYLKQVEVEPQPFDRFMNLLALAGLAVLVALPAVYYADLPSQIPIHFNLKGEPDAWAEKGFIWLLPAVGILIYGLITFVGNNPEHINYPGKITAENAGRIVGNMFRMGQTLKAGILCLFAWITWSIIQTALGEANGLGSYFLPVFLLLVLGPIAYFMLKASGK